MLIVCIELTRLSSLFLNGDSTSKPNSTHTLWTSDPISVAVLI